MLGHLDPLAAHVQPADRSAQNVPAGIHAQQIETFPGATSQVAAMAGQVVIWTV